jgi:uncharacterized protein (TIGR02996 family)
MVGHHKSRRACLASLLVVVMLASGCDSNPSETGAKAAKPASAAPSTTSDNELADSNPAGQADKPADETDETGETQDPEVLLKQVLEHPALDEPRRKYAAYLKERGDPRGEFIEAQLLLANVPPDDRRPYPDIRVARRTSKRLLDEHREAWVEPIAPFVEEAIFHRGFVASIRLSAQDWLDHHETILALEPVQHLFITEMDASFEEFIHHPSLAQMRKLSMASLGLDDEDLAHVCSSDSLTNLRLLWITGNNIGREGVECLIDPDTLPKLYDVALAGNGYNPTMIVHTVGPAFDVIDYKLNKSAAALEAEHGRIEWLHHPHMLTDLHWHDYSTDRYLEWEPPSSH